MNKVFQPSCLFSSSCKMISVIPPGFWCLQWELGSPIPAYAATQVNQTKLQFSFYSSSTKLSHSRRECCRSCTCLTGKKVRGGKEQRQYFVFHFEPWKKLLLIHIICWLFNGTGFLSLLRRGKLRAGKPCQMDALPLKHYFSVLTTSHFSALWSVSMI